MSVLLATSLVVVAAGLHQAERTAQGATPLDEGTPAQTITHSLFIPLVAQRGVRPASLPVAPASGWVLKQPGYVVEVVATGLQLPVNIAFARRTTDHPTAPYFYVVELYGTIKVVLRDGSVRDYATGLLNFEPTGKVPGTGELGVAGIAVEPKSGDLFVTLVYDADPPNLKFSPKVLRLHSDDGGRTLSQITTVLDMVGTKMKASHQISTITIGPDGKLYIQIGDAWQYQAALALDSLRGKILRINQDGTPAHDNPLFKASDGIAAEDFIYAYGFRNPFGGAWRQADQSLYVVENGPHVDRLARIVAGESYGWAGSDNDMRTHALYNWEPSAAPVNIAFVQPGVYGGSGFPPEKMNHAYVTESGGAWNTGSQMHGKRIVEFAIGARGVSLEGPFPLVEYQGEGRATAAALAAGPDGLYFSDLYKDRDYQSPIDRGANILRIRYVGGK